MGRGGIRIPVVCFYEIMPKNVVNLDIKEKTGKLLILDQCIQTMYSRNISFKVLF